MSGILDNSDLTTIVVEKCSMLHNPRMKCPTCWTIQSKPPHSRLLPLKIALRFFRPHRIKPHRGDTKMSSMLDFRLRS